MENVHQLPLVLMKPLYLHVEDRPGVHIDPVMLLNILCQAQLVMILDVHKLLLAFLIVHIHRQLLDLGQIRDPLVADLIRDPVRQHRIAVEQEASLGDAVGLVVELLGHHLIKIAQLLLFQDLRMELRHTVDRIAAYDGKMGHPHLAVVNNGHFADLFLIARIALLDLLHKPAVDLLHDLVDTRKQAGKQLDGPFLQRLGHDSMVGVSAGLRRDLPCLVPAQVFLIQEDPHQLGHSHRRVGVVHMEGCLLIEFADIVMLFFIFFHSPLYAGGNKEILLL